MRATLAGERQGSIGVIAGLLAVLFLGVASIGLNIKHAYDLDELHDTLQARCEARVEYDRRFIRAAEGDARFYSDAIALVDRAAEARTEPLSVAVQKLVDDQRQMLLDARDRKRAIVSQGVIGNCDQYALVTQR